MHFSYTKILMIANNFLLISYNTTSLLRIIDTILDLMPTIASPKKVFSDFKNHAKNFLPHNDFEYLRKLLLCLIY